MRATIITLCVLLSGCASTHKSDPLEPYNRVMYKVNRGIDKAVVRPLAIFYRGATPRFMQSGVRHFFNNLGEVTTVANDILQFRFADAVFDTTRLVTNTTLGIGGLFDVAHGMGIERNSTDFGYTLATWGWENSSYFVIPLLGPSTIRDTIGLVPDYFIEPRTWALRNDPQTRNWLAATDIISTRALYLHQDKVMSTAAMDEYTFVRNAYLQRRNVDAQEHWQNEELTDAWYDDLPEG